MNAEFLNNVSLAMNRNFNETRVAGSQIAVIRRGETVYRGAAGLMDVEKGAPLVDNAIFRIYSMTKPIVMAGLMRLVEKGLVFLEDPLYEYIPEFKDTPVARQLVNGVDYVSQSPHISVKNLMTMTSGLSYPGEEDYGSRSMSSLESSLSQDDMPTVEFVKLVAKNAVLSFQPGERWKYGYSHDVVGALIEVVSGMTLGAYLKKEIFEPLGMKDTSFWVPEEKAARFVSAYTVENGAFKRLTEKTYNDDFMRECLYESGGGGLVSTLDDYAKFCQAMLNGGTLGGYRLLGSKTVKMMATNQLNDRQLQTFGWLDRGYGYGLGMRVCLRPWIINGSVGEYGWDGMMGTFMLIDPAEEMIIVYMQNMFPSGNYGFKLLPTVYAAL